VPRRFRVAGHAAEWQGRWASQPEAAYQERVRSDISLLLVLLASSFGFGIAMLVASFLAIPFESPSLIEFFDAPMILFFSLLPESVTRSMSEAEVFWLAVASVAIGWALAWLVLSSVFFQFVRRSSAVARLRT
jgi:hypothetical protein